MNKANFGTKKCHDTYKSTLASEENLPSANKARMTFAENV